jgi:GT2 family glycosyltransferase
MSAARPAISVVVSTRDRVPQLRALLRSLRAQTLDPARFEVVVVDNGSVDATPELLRREAADSPFALIARERERGEGPAAARNDGWRAATAPLIAFTDDDCVATPRWLEDGLEALSGADLVQGSVRPDPGVTPGPFDRTLWVDGENGLYETANLFARRELLERVGGFEPLLPREVERVIGEDVWLGWRARRAGARTGFCDSARVHHAVIPRGPLGMIGERRRLRYFPELTRCVPELRGRHFAGLFLSRRTAEFDLALLSAVAVLRSRRRPLLLGAIPYLRTIALRAAPRGRRGPLVALAEVAADLVGLLSLIEGSIRSRTPVL